MNLNLLYYHIVIVLIFVSCIYDNQHYNEIYTNNHKGSKLLKIDSVKLEKIVLEDLFKPQRGFFEISNDTLIYIDKQFAWTYLFDKDGNKITRHLGPGNDEFTIPITSVNFYSLMPDGGHYFLGNSYDVHHVSIDYQRISSYYIDWTSFKSNDYLTRFTRNRNPEWLARNPKPEHPLSYNLAYGVGNLKTTSTHAYLPLASPPPYASKFNLSTDFYNNNARVIARLNIDNAIIENIIGRLPPIYYKNENIRLFSNINFDIIDDECLIITFQADSLIYIFDLEFKNNKNTFGFKGKDMNINYNKFPENLDDYNKLVEYWTYEKTERGYYTSIKHLSKYGITFRSYQKGKTFDNDGLQIYDGFDLIADVNVPKSFYVVGSIGDYFYSGPFITEGDSEVYIYKFKIDINNHD